MIDLSSGDGIEVSLRELAFEDNCRVPVVGGFICKASFLEKVAGMGPFWGNPREIAVEAYRRLGVDLIMQFVLPKPDEVSTKSSKPTNFTRREKRDFASPEDVVESIRQLPSGSELQSSFDHKSSTEEYERILIQGQREMGSMLWIPYTGTACRFMWYGEYGFRPYFLAIMKYPDDVESLYGYSGDLARMKNAALAEAILENGLPPYVYFGEDICYNKGPMVPVSILREIYFPHLRRAVEPLKEAGLRIIWHSDGNIMPILDDLLDCGVDGFQGFQQETGPTLEHFAGLKSRKGNKLILWGSV